MRVSEAIPVDIIAPLGNRRQVNSAAVSRLAESMRVVGLRTPITIRIVENYRDADGVIVDGQPVLVTGAHRLAAAKSLGWEKIECFVFDGESDVDAELWEIDENLCRHELTATEIAEHIAKRKELWEAREKAAQVEPKLKTDDNPKGAGRPDGFASDTAKASGQSKASVNRAVKRGNEVCQEARDLIRNTKLDTGKFLDSLLKLSPERQVEYAQQQLDALADKERMAALKEQQEQREREAKELRESAHIECMNFLCDMMSARQWAQFIDLVERAGGSIKSAQLRKWQSP